MQRDVSHAKPMYKKGRPGEKDKTLERANEAIPSFHTDPPAANSDELSYRTNDMSGMFFISTPQHLIVYGISSLAHLHLTSLLLVRAAEKYWPMSCLITAWS